MSLTSDEVNYLIFRYLQESGFHHSAFSLSNEALLSKCNFNAADVPPGSLIQFLQKGLLYKEIECHLREDGSEASCNVAVSLVTPHVCKAKEKSDKGDKKEHKRSRAAERETEEDEDDGRKFSKVEKHENHHDGAEIPDSQATILRGHQGEVFICSWSPHGNMLASGSGDATARIWRLNSSSNGEPRSIVLQHTNTTDNKDVTTLDWHPDGNLLATGSYDGLARIWSDTGNLITTLNKHKGPIFSLKWNKAGDSLLSGSVDKTAIIWDAKGQVKQQFEFHKAPTLDIDWRNNTSFASCSTDKMIYVCELGKNKPLKTFQGHTDEVNAIKWDPSGTLLASCSDDFTAKIWSMKQDKCVHDLKEHSREIYTIKWSPTGPGSENPNRPLLLASASFDSSVKLWDAETGSCVHTLVKHVDPVYSVAFSPSGEYLASGSFDRSIHIWNVRDGRLLKTYRGNGGVFEVCWNNTGDRLAASFSNNTVCVLDLRL